MKRFYLAPELEMIKLSSEDVMTASTFEGIIMDDDWSNILD